MPRLFIAIDLPEAHRAALAALRDDALAARWTRPGQHHLTLRFVGEVHDALARRLEASLAAVQAPPVPLQIEGLGAFPSMRRPRVLFAGLPEAPRLAALRHQVEDAVLGIGLPPDPKPFRPHVTLARLKRCPPRLVRAFVRRHESLTLPPFEAKRFVLYESVLRAEGALHRMRAAYPLAG